MKFRSFAGSMVATGAMIIGLGAAHAEPAVTPARPIGYSAGLVGRTIVVTLDGGTFDLAEKPPGARYSRSYIIKDENGNGVVSLLVNISIADRVVPVEPVVKQGGRVLELTPHTPGDSSRPTIDVNAVAPIASPTENQKAMSEFSTQFGIATAVGGFLGTAIGVVAGGVIGCIFGLPLLAVGCIPAAIAGAGIIGTLAVGGPVLTIAGIDLIDTLRAPPGTSKYAESAQR
jgi:hypothetical protein